MGCRILGKLQKGLSSYRLLSALEAASFGGKSMKQKYVFAVVLVDKCGGVRRSGHVVRLYGGEGSIFHQHWHNLAACS